MPKFESKVRSLVNLVRVLVGCDFLYNDFDDRVVETIDDYKLSTGSATAGKLVRLWHNSCVSGPDDYDIEINNLASIITSDELDTAILVIRKEDVIYNAIPLACTSFGGIQLYSVYENDAKNTAHFQRLVDILNYIFNKEYAYDPELHVKVQQEHIILRCFKAQVILALALKYALNDSHDFNRDMSRDIITVIANINYKDNTNTLGEIFKSSVQEIFELTKQMTFVEIIRYLFEENAFVKYYRQMSNEIYRLEHPTIIPTTNTNQTTSTPAPSISKDMSVSKDSTETFEAKMESAFDVITAKAKATRLKDRKMSVAVEDSNVPNTRMFA